MKKHFFKKIFAFALAFSLLAFLAGASWAQEDAGGGDAAGVQRVAPSAPYYVAMVFSRLTGGEPDFNGWARNTKAYQDANEADKLLVVDQQVQKFKSIYSLLTLDEPLVVEMPVDLSAYSAGNGGFFVKNFTDKTFFPVQFNGRSYAIVPQGIVDKQWIKISAAAAKAVAALAASGRKPVMTLFLAPKYADSSAPATLAGTSYWLISAETKKMMLYDGDSGALLWQSEDAAAADPRHQELLNLRQ